MCNRILTTTSAMAHHLTTSCLQYLLLFIVLFVPPGAASAQQLPADAPRGAGLLDDSLDLRDVELDLERARIRLHSTNLVRRLLGSLQLSVSLGLRDLLFIDRTTALPYAFPNDAYRASISFSPDIFFGSDHELAACDLRKVESLRDRTMRRQAEVHEGLRRNEMLLSSLKAFLLEDLRIRENLSSFNDLRFRQGKINYDLLMRSHLELLGSKVALARLEAELGELQAKLQGPPE